MRRSIDESLAALPIVTWVLENHDVTRIVTRFGEREARAAALLLLALPGPVFLYQGQELGLEEVDLPDAKRQDPVFFHSQGRQPGRDGCRIPLPWRRGQPHAGFSVAEPWLPMPAGWDGLAVDVQAASAASMLGHFRRALAARRELGGRLPGRIDWLEISPTVIGYRRGPLVVVCNFGRRSARLRMDGRLLMGSDPLVSSKRGQLQMPASSAAWLYPVARP